MLPGTGSYTQPRKQIGEQYGREERRLPIHSAIQCRRPKPPAGSRYPERTGAAQGAVPCQCRDPLHKLPGVSRGRSYAQDRPADSGTVGTRDTIQHAAGSHPHSGGEYSRRSSACHGISKHPVRCRHRAGGRWFPFAPELSGCDTGVVKAQKGEEIHPHLLLLCKAYNLYLQIYAFFLPRSCKHITDVNAAHRLLPYFVSSKRQHSTEPPQFISLHV